MHRALLVLLIGVALNIGSASADMGRTIQLKHTAVSCATTSTAAVSAHEGRSLLVLQNDGSNVIYVNFAGASVANTGLRVNASGGNVIFDVSVPGQAMTCIAITGTTTLLVTEGF